MRVPRRLRRIIAVINLVIVIVCIRINLVITRRAVAKLVGKRYAVNRAFNAYRPVVNGVLDAALVGNIGIKIVFGCNLVERHDDVRLRDC